MIKRIIPLILGILLAVSCKPSAWTNPVFDGWYADPEGFVDGRTLWVYPTASLPFDDQTYLDAFSTKDMIHWEKHPRIVSDGEISWARRALWAPSIVKKDGLYYLFFSANDVHQGEVGGIGVAVSEKPEGPFRDLLGRPLIQDVVNGAQPIDQFVFQDPASGDWLMYYGGWKHCNLVRLSPDFKSLLPFEDGDVFKEVTPEGYVEGPFMLLKDGKYYFMWSEGRWRKDNYCVAYAIADSPFGPFVRENTILQTDPEVGTGAGHHSVVRDIRTGEYLIVYHRHPLGDSDGNHRQVCIDRLEFSPDGKILPVKMRR
ncbi:MAG: glycoside hydrolase family 43 protein [Bacteroidales bacterium]|nr:glycoside hydrolase family 43 protein [Bacteroidales bacterium]